MALHTAKIGPLPCAFRQGTQQRCCFSLAAITFLFYFLPQRLSLPTFEPVSPLPCVTGKGYVVWNLAFAVCLWHTVNVPDPLVEAREGEEERTRK